MTQNQTNATRTGTAVSRARQVKPATRKPTKARLAISGASGSGKTWTALSIADVLVPAGRTVVIDSEPSDDMNTAAELYADTFDFHLIDWRQPPFDPRDLALTIRELGTLGETDVLIVDSASAFWRGDGGTLDIADGRFGGWKSATPAQNDLVDAFLNAPFHVIFCTRAKQAYNVEEQGGRQRVTKLGLAPIQRDDLEYEFQVVVMMDETHRIDVGKTRCDDLAGQSFHANKQSEFGRIYKQWLDRGPEVARQWQVDLVTKALNAVQPGDKRVEMKRAYVEEFGLPNELDPEKWGPVWAWLSSMRDIDPHAYIEEPPDDEHEGELRCEVCGLGARAGWHAGEPQGPQDRPTRPAGGDGEPAEAEAGEAAPGAEAEPLTGDDPVGDETAAPDVPEHDGEPTDDEDEGGPEATPDVATYDDGSEQHETITDRAVDLAEWTQKLSTAGVARLLTLFDKPTTGAPKTQRKRLLDFLLNVLEGHEQLPQCDTCHKWPWAMQGAPALPIAPHFETCDCPI